MKIKTEEEFDHRQEEARKKRLERSSGTYCSKRGYSDMKDQIKQEKQDPDSNERSGIHRRGPRGQDRGGANRYDHHSRHDFTQERSFKQERQNNDDQRMDNHHQRGQRQVQQAFESKPEPPVEKEKPNLGLSGALTADTNTFRGVVIKYSEPPEARKPKKRWRLYPFKEDQTFDTIHLHRQSGYLMGRLRRVVDIAIDHPSCSKQHAAFQFRAVEKVIRGVKKLVVRPYIMDLNSGNGTFLNGEKIEAQRYYELKERDVLRFGTSIRDYVLLHQNSDTRDRKSVV